MVQRDVTYRVFSSFEEEAVAECLRRSEQSPEDRINEFAILQERCWGEKWTSQKMVPVVSFERGSFDIAGDQISFRCATCNTAIIVDFLFERAGTAPPPLPDP
jgi:hypothetical protein